MKADCDGVVREKWVEPLRHGGPVTPVVGGRSIVTSRSQAMNQPSAEGLYADRFDAWGRGIEEAIDDDVADGGDGVLTGADVAPWIAANLLEAVDREIAGVLDKLRLEAGALRRSLEVERERRTAERRRRAIETVALRRQVAELEVTLRAQAETHAAALVEMHKVIASLEVSAARDRAHRRLLDSRRQYPAAQRADLERARRATDRAIEGTRQ